MFCSAVEMSLSVPRASHAPGTANAASIQKPRPRTNLKLSIRGAVYEKGQAPGNYTGGSMRPTKRD